MNGARDTRRFPVFTVVDAARPRPPAANGGFANGRDEITAVGPGPAIPPRLTNDTAAPLEAAPRSTLLPVPPRRSTIGPLPDLTFDDPPEAAPSIYRADSSVRTRVEDARLSHLPLADLVNHFARIARERERMG